MDTVNSSVKPSLNPPEKKNTVRKVILITTLILVVGLTAYYFICGMTYSEGTRSGVLTKVSKKGYFFKTFEGELNVGGLDQGDGTIMPMTVFKFSIEYEKTYKKLDELQGRKVILHYNQVIKNFVWQGETDYFVDDAKAMNK
jgi:hypothetical protein